MPYYDSSGDTVTSSTAYFYGLPLTSQASFNVEYMIDNINPEWAPSNTGDFLTNTLYLRNGLNPSNRQNVDSGKEIWKDTHRNTQFHVSENLEANYSQGDMSTLKYSRDSGNPNSFIYPQFEMQSVVDNNILQSQRPIVDLIADVSYNNKYAWWDYTWSTAPSVPSVNNPKNISAINNVAGSSASIGISLTDMPQPIPFEETAAPFITTFSQPPVPTVMTNFRSDISYNTAMWAKNAYWSSSGHPITGTWKANRTTNPYIDYTKFEGTGLKDYKHYDSSGNTESWSIGKNYVSGTFLSTQNYSVTNSKWVCLRVDLGNIPSWQVCKIEVKDASGNVATIGQDYFLFIKEQVQVSTDQMILWLYSSDPNDTSSILNGGNFVLSTPWLDATVDKQPSTNSYKPFVEAQAPTSGSAADNSAFNGIALSSGTTTWSSTAPSVGHAHAGKAIYQFLAFCIPNDNGISEIKLTYTG